MVTGYEGRIVNGQLEFEDGSTLPDGTRVLVFVTDENDGLPAKGITGAEIMESGMFGLWADREDITDSAEFVEQLRRKAEQRVNRD